MKLLWPIVALLAAFGCGGESSDGCHLAVTEINGAPVEGLAGLSNGADRNADLPGIQVVVRVDAMGLDDGTAIALDVLHAGVSESTQGASVAQGQANFSAVDLGTDGSVSLVPSLPDGRQCAISTHALVVQTVRCAVTTPLEGDVLNRMDDLDPTTPELLETAVRVATNAPDRSTAALSIAGTPVAEGATVLGFTALFERATLPDMEGVLLDAVVSTEDGGEATCSVTVDVDMGFDSCTLTVPSAQNVGTLGPLLNGADDDDGGTQGLQTDVLVSTDALTGSSVDLLANDQPLATADFDALGQTTFMAQTLPQGSLVLRAVCHDASGNELRSPPYPVTVDSVPPDAVDDMSCSVFDRRTASLRCTWTAPAESGTGLAGYDLRYLTGTADIALASFPSAALATPTVVPVPSGAEQTYLLASDADNPIRLGSSYDVAVVAWDAAGNVSGLSNDTPHLLPSLNEQSLVGEDGISYFGFSAAAGDFNCDGIGDLAVGAPYIDSQPGPPLNRVYLYFGGPQGLPSYYDTRILSQRPSNFGVGLTTLGNFDGDTMGTAGGCDDLAVDANYESKLYVFLGRPAWFDRTDEDVGTGAELIVAGENAGWSGRIAGGDFNGDGRGDLVYGVHDVTAMPARPTRVQLLLGHAVPLMDPAGVPMTLSAVDDADVSIDAGDFESFGGYLSASDINGDGFDDALIGHYEYDLTPNDNVGAAYVVYGSASPPATLDVTVPSPAFSRIVGGPNNYNVGWAVNGAGDLDGDGANELAVGDLSYSTPAANAGIAYLFTGLDVGVNQSVDDAVWTIGNGMGADSAGDYLGRAFVEGGERLNDTPLDVDQDGYADLVLAETAHGTEVGSVLIYFGGAAGPVGNSNTSADIRLVAPAGASGLFGTALVSVGQPDFNGDGFGDFAVTDATFGACPGPGACGRLTVYW